MTPILSRSDWSQSLWRLLVRVTLVVALAYCLWRIRFIVATTIAAVMLAYLLLPFTVWLERQVPLKVIPPHHRRSVAAIAALIAALAVMVWSVTATLQPLVVEVKEFFDNFNLHAEQFQRRFQDLNASYELLPPQVKRWLASLHLESLAAGAGEWLQHLLARSVHATMFVVELILIPVLAYYFITEGSKFKKEFAFLVPRKHWRDALFMMRESSAILQSYAVGQMILALLAGIVVWLLMVAMGIQYALAMAIVAAITRAIPVVGPILGGIPIVLMATLQSWQSGLTVLVAFSLMHLIESKLIMPKLIGYRVNLHPAIIIVVLLIGAEFWGMWGMFIAAPVAAILKVFINHFWVKPARPTGPPAGPSTHEDRPTDEERTSGGSAPADRVGRPAGTHRVPAG